jgi:hypothetical protein
MIVTSIAGTVREGKLHKATDQLRKYQDIVKEIAGVEVQIAGRVGAIGEVMVFTQHDNATDMEEAIAKLWGSEAYLKVMDDAAEIFDPESTRVEIWKVMS